MIAVRPAWLRLAVVVASAACVRNNATPTPKELTFGVHRVQLIVPTGWEALDQGKQKRFRKGEFEIVLANLGPSTSLGPAPSTPVGPPLRPASPLDLDALINWGLVEVGHGQRREEKSRRALMLDGREAMDIETWNRLDHTSPQRILFVNDNGDLLALYTVGMASEDSLAAFDAIRDSLHLVSDLR